MTDLEFQRPYQYVDELRLLGVVRNADSTIFTGTNFNDDAEAYLVTGSVLTQLKTKSVNHSDFDILTAEGFQAAYPYTLYVVNPNNEDGQASNAMVFDKFDAIPVLDVKVDGLSVVKGQVADIDLTKKLDRHMQSNMLYGTDGDGQDKMYDVNTMLGVQDVQVNGAKVQVQNHTAVLDDIANTSKTVQRANSADVIYGTDRNGNETTFSKSDFATTSDLGSSNAQTALLAKNKQDKDSAAVDGSIAMMKSNQSVGSTYSLADSMKQLQNNTTDLADIKTEVETLQAGTDKDWKAVSSDAAYIKNNPISDTLNNITITNKDIEDEADIRLSDNSIILATNPSLPSFTLADPADENSEKLWPSNMIAIGNTVNVSQDSIAVGKENFAGQQAISVGLQSQAGAHSVSIGTLSEAASDGSIAIGYRASANQDTVDDNGAGIAIGLNASATKSGSVAIGFKSVNDVAETVSVGNADIKRRIRNVGDPVDANDAATKQYVDSHSSSGGGTTVVSQKGVPVYIVSSASATSSIQGEAIARPCLLVIPTSNPPQIIYSTN